jgi:Tfp pilus assembly protein PilF
LLLHPLSNLATIYAESGQRDEADATFRRALLITQSRLGNENSTYGNLLHSYATFLHKGGHKSEAKVIEARSKQVLTVASRRSGVGETIDIAAFAQK